jgi:periplasmic protein TonB
MDGIALKSATNNARLFKLSLPWLGSVLFVFFMVVGIFLLNTEAKAPEDTLSVRSVEVAEIPPPEPPPARQQEVKTENNSTPGPTIDLLGQGSGPAIAYSENPKLAIARMQQIEKPEFNKESLDIGNNLTVSFPLHQVEELDSVPRLLSSNHISFPRKMRESGIDKVATKVEIIIDAQGKAYVKKIVDPVYPEMVEVIRKAINDSRFTVPTKNGRPVQAVYLYNLTFINRI